MKRRNRVNSYAGLCPCMRETVHTARCMKTAFWSIRGLCAFVSCLTQGSSCLPRERNRQAARVRERRVPQRAQGFHGPVRLYCALQHVLRGSALGVGGYLRKLSREEGVLCLWTYSKETPLSLQMCPPFRLSLQLRRVLSGAGLTQQGYCGRS